MRIDNEHCEFQRDDEQNIMKFMNVRTRKSMGGDVAFSDWYANEVNKLFMPCYDMVVNGILRDRPQMLLGEWMKWKYLGI